MKINWAYAIIGLFVGFVALIMFLVTNAFKHEVNLVSEDYYEKEIKYQQQIEKLQNTVDLNDKISFTQSNDHLILSFDCPVNSQEGEITFFRPSDAKKDLKEKLSLNKESEQYFDRKKFQTGYYKMQIDWTSNGKEYYVEKDIFIQ